MTNKFNRIHTNTNKKYIIQNCPCYNNERFIEGFLEGNETLCTYYKKNCQDCTDCVLKQIVELAKEYKEELIDRKTKKVVATRYFKLTKEILELLDIREVE